MRAATRSSTPTGRPCSRARRSIGRISRQWFKVRDTYGVEVEPGEDTALVIAIAICIDRLREQERRRAMASG